MGMAAGTTLRESEVASRPLSVTVFVSCMGAFVLADTASYYPRELFPGAVWALPFLSLLFGILALGIWNGSRALWVANVWLLGSLLLRVGDALTGSSELLGPAWDFNQTLLRGVTAVVLLSILFSPSLVRWMWRKGTQKSY